MRVEEATVSGWPGFLITAQRLRVGVISRPGGRVISLCHDDEELLFVQPEHRGEHVDLSGDLAGRKAELGFRVWGGNKTWVAPQSRWLDGTPPLDLDAGEYGVEIADEGITMVSPVCRETGVEITRRVRIDDDSTVVIEHHGDPGAGRGLWGVTQWLRPLSVYFAGAPRPYPEEGTTEELMRAHVDSVDGWTRVRARDAVQLKVGARATRGELIALRPSDDETLVIRYRFEAPPDAAYAHDASIEVFNSRDYPYLEIELHAPLGAASLTERIHIERRAGRVGIGEV